MSLKDETRIELKRRLAHIRMSGMFGDGLEMEYIYNGCTIIGLNETTDEDLVQEYSDSVWLGDDETDSLLDECKAQMGISLKIQE